MSDMYTYNLLSMSLLQCLAPSLSTFRALFCCGFEKLLFVASVQTWLYALLLPRRANCTAPPNRLLDIQMGESQWSLVLEIVVGP